MPTKNELLWTGRQDKIWDEQRKLEKQFKNERRQFYNAEFEKLNEDIASYYGMYADDDVINYSDMLNPVDDSKRRKLQNDIRDFKDKYPKYASMVPMESDLMNLNHSQGMQLNIFLQQYELAIDDMEKARKQLTTSAVLGASLLLYLGRNKEASEMAKLNTDQYVGAMWTGSMNFSQRIWRNRNNLANYLYNDFTNALKRGDSYQRIVKHMSNRFKHVSLNDIYRLVYTEGTYVLNESMGDTFIKIGYDKYRYSAIMDSVTTEICRSLNGQVFNLKDRQAGVNFPAMHVRCRSSFTIVDNDVVTV